MFRHGEPKGYEIKLNDCFMNEVKTRTTLAIRIRKIFRKFANRCFLDLLARWLLLASGVFNVAKIEVSNPTVQNMPPHNIEEGR